ncbi:MAG TPA: DUF1918 domain-containing protein [Amycolatopsis sp.]|nr:DUF1918 domain-containing protein [Amycolatopsis sp.]
MRAWGARAARPGSAAVRFADGHERLVFPGPDCEVRSRAE